MLSSTKLSFQAPTNENANDKIRSLSDYLLYHFEVPTFFDSFQIICAYYFTIEGSFPFAYVMRPPLTEHVPLHSKSLCKNMARASGGAHNMHSLS